MLKYCCVSIFKNTSHFFILIFLNSSLFQWKERPDWLIDATNQLSGGGASVISQNIPTLNPIFFAGTSTMTAETNETDPHSHKSNLDSSASLKTGAREEYKRTSGQPLFLLPTEYANLQDRSGTKDKIYAQPAWMEKPPKPRDRLPSISPVKQMSIERRYSLMELLKAQGVGKSDGSEERLVGNQEPTATTNIYESQA